ncbi:MAG: alpha/beta hydrolase [Acidimicrobiales bacterium]|jgi:acetyl esterase
MSDAPTSDEGVLDPWVAEWMAANPERATPFADLVPELLELARGDYGPQLTQKIDHVDDDHVGDVPIRIYRNDGGPTGLVVYFHGGGHVIGSIGIMDGVAREIAHASGAVVVSVGYRLAPEDPYPAALDDCTAVTSWTLAECGRFGLPPSAVAVAGESAGGTMAAAVALRLRDAGGAAPVGQVLIYPAVAGSKILPSREEFSGLVISLEAGEAYWTAYSGGRDLDDDPYAAPLHAPSLAGLPPALVILGGCDMLRDEGRAYADRLTADGVDAEEVCYPGQPHGFLNFGFPAAALAFERTGVWLRRRFEEARAPE